MHSADCERASCVMLPAPTDKRRGGAKHPRWQEHRRGWHGAMTWRVFDRQRHRGAGYSSLAFLDNARPRNLNASAHCGAVAQMGERCNRTAEVRGSIPLGSTNSFKALDFHRRFRLFAGTHRAHTGPTPCGALMLRYVLAQL